MFLLACAFFRSCHLQYCKAHDVQWKEPLVRVQELGCVGQCARGGPATTEPICMSAQALMHPASFLHSFSPDVMHPRKFWLSAASSEIGRSEGQLGPCASRNMVMDTASAETLCGTVLVTCPEWEHVSYSREHASCCCCCSPILTTRKPLALRILPFV